MEHKENEYGRRISDLINADDVQGLLQAIEGHGCACLGPRDGEKLCPCRTNSLYVRGLVSYAALKRGRVVKLKLATTQETSNDT